MHIIVGDRQSGKTQRLVDWLVEGHATGVYPHWNRVIVCTSNERVISVTQRVKEITYKWLDRREMYDCNKCVWGLGDLQSAFRLGHYGFEYAVDDLDVLIYNMLSGSDVRVHELPKVVAFNAESVTQLPVLPVRHCSGCEGAAACADYPEEERRMERILVGEEIAKPGEVELL